MVLCSPNLPIHPDFPVPRFVVFNYSERNGYHKFYSILPWLNFSVDFWAAGYRKIMGNFEDFATRGSAATDLAIAGILFGGFWEFIAF